MIFQENVFVDSSAWVALADKDDNHHRKAVSIYPVILKSQKALVTSNLIIAETHVLILHELGYRAATDFLKSVRNSPRIMTVYSTAEIEADAEVILIKYADQDFSYTDAVSFAIMKRQKIRKAFCFDRHFLTAGFEKIP
ncbi:MAG TPA: PIN domain-containing protein [Thermodesulfovibrionales bacterium]|nr:PIN domain-containing protein [Thermodesulfovibrionales bacterium]